MSKETTEISNLVLDFKPIFFILDKCQLTVLAAKKQDKYEVSGVYLRLNRVSNKWDMWTANFNNQLPWEFPERFIITKDEQEAWLFAEVLSTANPLPHDWCLKKFPRATDFPKY